MKKVILSLALIFGVAMVADAQCSGSKTADTGSTAAACCSKGKASTASADVTPSIGADIEQRTDAAGGVSYVRKVVNAENGSVSYTAVEYCTKTNQFVEAGAATTSMEKKANCSDAEKAGCCSSKSSKTDAAPVKGKGAKTKV